MGVGEADAGKRATEEAETTVMNTKQEHLTFTFNKDHQCFHYLFFFFFVINIDKINTSI